MRIPAIVRIMKKKQLEKRIAELEKEVAYLKRKINCATTENNIVSPPWNKLTGTGIPYPNILNAPVISTLDGTITAWVRKA
jgi:hypothetical protein